MLNDIQARCELKKMVENHLLGVDPDANCLINLIMDSSRQIPIRGVMQKMSIYRVKEYTEFELKLIDELMYLYG